MIKNKFMKTKDLEKYGLRPLTSEEQMCSLTNSDIIIFGRESFGGSGCGSGDIWGSVDKIMRCDLLKVSWYVFFMER